MFKIKVVLTAFWLFFTLYPCVFALGEQEDERIAQVEKLLDQKKLSDAEKLLIEIMKTNPSQSNTTRFLLDKIRSMRAEYNTKLKEFMDLLEQGDEKAIYDKIAELEALDSSPSALGSTILSQARENAWVAINLKKYFDIMDTAELSLKAGNYKKALEIYTRVFELHKQDFYDDKEYTAVIKNSIRDITESINKFIELFDGLLPKIEQTVNDFNGQLTTFSTERLSAGAADLRSTVNGLLGVYFEIERAAKDIRQINEGIKKRYNKPKGDFHLYYIYRVAHGRDYTDHTEGMLYAVQRQWEEYVQTIETGINRIAEPVYFSAKNQLLNKEYDSASKAFTRVYNLYFWQIKFSSQWMFSVLNRDNRTLNTAEWERLKSHAPAFIQAQERAKEARSYIKLITFYSQKDKYVKQPPKTDQELDEYRNEIRRTVVDIQQMAVSWRNQVAYLDTISKNGFEIHDADYSARDMLSRVESVSTAYRDLEKNAVRVMLQAQVDLYAATFEQSRKDVKKADELRQKKQPTEALHRLEETGNTLTGLIRDIDGFIVKWSGAESYISEDRAVQDIISAARDIRRNAESLKNGMQDDIATVRAQSYEAGQHREKGLVEYKNAHDSFERNRFAQAKAQLKTASEELTKALEYEENPDLHKMVDEEFTAFDKQIMEKWKNQSIIQVRNLINNAQQDYSQLLFEDAENQLLKAQDLSNEINPAEPDQEIIIWLDIVRSALSARSSREIKEEEVNYAEMTQLFNLANKDYADGVAELKKGNKEQADRLFQSARDKIALIKRSYPYHRDSRVLLYKIEQATRSKADFNAYLQVQVNNADQLLNKRNYLEAYAIYQDIQEIDPRYPGINAKVRRAEELVGIRARQPSQADQARSAELVRLARESSANKEYQTAIGYLNDALRLNPFNRTAAVLKDRINEIVAPPSSILPVEAQELYNSAVVSYNNKEYLRARQLLSQIKRDFPQQARNSKVVELEEKIKSRIGS